MPTEQATVDVMELSGNLTVQVRLKRTRELRWRLKAMTLLLWLAAHFAPMELEVITPRPRWDKPPREWLDD